MQWMKRFFIAMLAAVQFASASAAEPLLGYEHFDISSAYRARPIAASVWYPAAASTYRGLVGDSAIFVGTSVYTGAMPAKGRYPLLLLSHGSGGNMDNISWLSSALAQRGMLVLAVNHPGSMSGDSSPRQSLRLDERASDLTTALDYLLADSTFSPLIDPARISAAGFSLGGATVLGMAGARFDRSQYYDYCTRLGKQAQDCTFLAKGGVDLAQLPVGFAADLYDSRISKIVAIDPSGTYAINKESAAAIKQPMLLINLGDKDRWKTADVGPNGSNLLGSLPRARYAVVAPASHFTFLAQCKPAAKRLLEEERDDPICDDPKGVDRASVHAEIIELMATFLR
jgi:predicted dienelactone hydrolase